jgi:hypothetical protein
LVKNSRVNAAKIPLYRTSRLTVIAERVTIGGSTLIGRVLFTYLLCSSTESNSVSFQFSAPNGNYILLSPINQLPADIKVIDFSVGFKRLVFSDIDVAVDLRVFRTQAQFSFLQVIIEIGFSQFVVPNCGLCSRWYESSVTTELSSCLSMNSDSFSAVSSQTLP